LNSLWYKRIQATVMSATGLGLFVVQAVLGYTDVFVVYVMYFITRCVF